MQGGGRESAAAAAEVSRDDSGLGLAGRSRSVAQDSSRDSGHSRFYELLESHPQHDMVSDSRDLLHTQGSVTPSSAPGIRHCQGLNRELSSESPACHKGSSTWVLA